MGTYYVPSTVCKHIRCIMSIDPQTILLISIITTHWRWGKWGLKCCITCPKHTTSNHWPGLSDSQGFPRLLATTLGWLASTSEIMHFLHVVLQESWFSRWFGGGRYMKSTEIPIKNNRLLSCFIFIKAMKVFISLRNYFYNKYK